MPIRRSLAFTPKQTAAEQLEVRILPTVTATLSRGTLTLKGDSTANDIRIEQDGGDLVLTGNGSTMIRFNGQFVGSVSLGGVQHLKGTFGAQNDRVAFEDGVQLGNVTLNLGGGSNGLVVRDTTSTGLFSVTGGSGLDRVWFDASTLNKMTLNLAGGEDELEFFGSEVSGQVLINMGDGLDVVATNEGDGGVDNKFFGVVTIKTGSQADTIDLSDASFAFLVIDSGADDDEIFLYGTPVHKAFTINAGSGNDTVRVSGVTQGGLQANSIMGGSGTDQVSVNSSGFASVLTIALGSGPGNVLELDDVASTTLVAVSSTGQNDEIRVEHNLNYTGSTELAVLAIQLGSGGTLAIGRDSQASYTEISQGVIFFGSKSKFPAIATIFGDRFEMTNPPLLQNSRWNVVG